MRALLDRIKSGSGMRPTQRGLVLLGLALVFMAGGLRASSLPLLLGAACLASVLLVDAVFLARGLKDRTLRVGPRRCVAGRPFLEEILVEAPTTAPRIFDVQILEAASRRRDSVATLREHVGGQRTLVLLDARFRERGTDEARVFEMRSLAPFSCFVRRCVHKVPAKLAVEPARLAIHDVWMQSLGAQVESHEESSMLRGDEFWSLRELEHGEDLRRVHAVRSMSRGALVARVTRGVLQTRLEIVLDVRARTDTMTQHSRFELALRFAASLSDRAEDPAIRLSATIVGFAKGCEHYDLELWEERHRFLERLAGASAQTVEALPRETLEHFERSRSGLRCILIESGVEDSELLKRIGDSVRPLHVRTTISGQEKARV